jgi:hypothetical protein
MKRTPEPDGVLVRVHPRPERVDPVVAAKHQAGGADPLPAVDLERYAGRKAQPATFASVTARTLAAGAAPGGVSDR